MSNFVSRIKRRIFRHYPLFKSLSVGIGVFMVTLFLCFFVFPFVRLIGNLPISPSSILSNPEKQLKNTDGRINILLLGIGGQLHDGPNLSDTIIVASIPLKTGPVYLISIPRDLYFPPIEEKINSAYAIGQEKKNGGGLILSKAAISQITGLPIHYGIRVDFSAFSEIVDLIGGIDINVPITFEDPRYPIEGKENDPCGGDKDYKCRYEILRFEKGMVHMDGKTALKFSRSRYSPGDEGTDFARSKRQQLVLSAIKNKVMTLPSLLNFSRLLEIYSTLKNHIDTDISDQEISAFFKLGTTIKDSTLGSVNIDDLLVNPPIDERGWILLPKTDDYEEIHTFVGSKIFTRP